MYKLIYSLIFLIFFVQSTGAIETCNGCKKNNPSIKLSEYDKKTICIRFLASYQGAINYIENNFNITFQEAYPLITCKSKADNFREWQLVGHGLTNPPSNQTFFATIKLLKDVKTNNKELLYYIYNHKDEKGQGIYDYINILKKQKPNQKSYYRRFEKAFKKFEPKN